VIWDVKERKEHINVVGSPDFILDQQMRLTLFFSVIKLNHHSKVDNNNEIYFLLSCDTVVPRINNAPPVVDLREV
jgi:hypothetical protein